MTRLVWFRRELRLRDNPALHAALERGETVLPVYIYTPEEEQPWAPGAASRWYLHQSLRALRHDLHDLGLELETARGPSGEHLLSVAARIGATRVSSPGSGWLPRGRSR
jgi:deoxyribodipyrimidine photo-lyase